MADALSHLFTALGYMKRQERRVAARLSGATIQGSTSYANMLAVAHPSLVPQRRAALRPGMKIGMEGGE